ncbi:MAG: hypothetical protein Q4B14_02150, partial [Clostridia bacterium]|nr:hypothetical protein [Clostridia bacterium]
MKTTKRLLSLVLCFALMLSTVAFVANADEASISTESTETKTAYKFVEDNAVTYITDPSVNYVLQADTEGAKNATIVIGDGVETGDAVYNIELPSGFTMLTEEADETDEDAEEIREFSGIVIAGAQKETQTGSLITVNFTFAESAIEKSISIQTNGNSPINFLGASAKLVKFPDNAEVSLVDDSKLNTAFAYLDEAAVATKPATFITGVASEYAVNGVDTTANAATLDEMITRINNANFLQSEYVPYDLAFKMAVPTNGVIAKVVAADQIIGKQESPTKVEYSSYTIKNDENEDTGIEIVAEEEVTAIIDGTFDFAGKQADGKTDKFEKLTVNTEISVETYQTLAVKVNITDEEKEGWYVAYATIDDEEVPVYDGNVVLLQNNVSTNEAQEIQFVLATAASIESERDAVAPISAGTGGRVVVDGGIISEGKLYADTASSSADTITVTPIPDKGYELSSWEIDGDPLVWKGDTNTEYYEWNTSSGLYAKLADTNDDKARTNFIGDYVDKNGVIYKDTDQKEPVTVDLETVVTGDAAKTEVEFVVTDEDGVETKMKAEGATYDTVTIENITSRRFTGIKANFVKVADIVSLDIASEEGGTVSPAGTQQVKKDETVSVVATPMAGYKFAGWKVNDSLQADATSPKLEITASSNTTIRATFAPIGTIKNINVGDKGLVYEINDPNAAYVVYNSKETVAAKTVIVNATGITEDTVYNVTLDNLILAINESNEAPVTIYNPTEFKVTVNFNIVGGIYLISRRGGIAVEGSNIDVNFSTDSKAFILLESTQSGNDEGLGAAVKLVGSSTANFATAAGTTASKAVVSYQKYDFAEGFKQAAKFGNDTLRVCLTNDAVESTLSVYATSAKDNFTLASGDLKSDAIMTEEGLEIEFKNTVGTAKLDYVVINGEAQSASWIDENGTWKTTVPYSVLDTEVEAVYAGEDAKELYVVFESATNGKLAQTGSMQVFDSAEFNVAATANPGYVVSGFELKASAKIFKEQNREDGKDYGWEATESTATYLFGDKNKAANNTNIALSDILNLGDTAISGATIFITPLFEEATVYNFVMNVSTSDASMGSVEIVTPEDYVADENGNVLVEQGGTFEAKAISAEGYEFKGWNIDGVAVSDSEAIKIVNINEDYMITAIFGEPSTPVDPSEPSDPS